MRVAVLYTGALRTVRKTLRYLKQNVLSVDHHVEIFACLQNDTTDKDDVHQEWLCQELRNRLVAVRWFRMGDYPGWVDWRDKTLQSMPISEMWKDYLSNSGSMIEYLQLHIAYQDMCASEWRQATPFDYIIRMRPDNMVGKPIDFHWLTWTDQQVEDRLNVIRSKEGGILDDQQVLHFFMVTVFDDHLIHDLASLIGKSRWRNAGCNVPTTGAEVNAYLRNAPYILTIRKNNIYIVRRNLFNLIPGLAYLYGSLRTPIDDSNFWFNAESQFENACWHSGLTIHDYNTALEDASLYNYDEVLYFDKDGNIVNPRLVYCLVRK